MILNIPFELGEKVYIIKQIPVYEKEWVPPDYSLGGDVDGPFDRGHWNSYIDHYNYRVQEIEFYFGLLDKYKLNEIYKNEEDANWALLLQLKKEGDPE